MIQRHQRQLFGIVQAALAEAAGESIEAGVRRLVAAAIEAHRVDPALHRVLAEQTPRSGALEDVEVFNRGSYDLFRAYLESRKVELRPIDLDLASFVCVTAIEALTHTAVIHRAELLTDAAVETLVDETARLILGYLR